jgi:hypothetical protein
VTTFGNFLAGAKELFDKWLWSHAQGTSNEQLSDGAKTM